MGHMSKHVQWYKRLTDGDTERTAALKAGVTTSTLNRQLAKGSLGAEVVILLSRAYGENPVMGLAATGYLTSDEATGLKAGDISELLTDQQMIRALALRIDADPEAWFGTFGELADEEPENELASLRSKKQADSHSDVTPARYAASRRKRQPEEGDDDYGDGA